MFEITVLPDNKIIKAKSGDNLVQITIREDDYGQRYIHYISSYKTTTKDNYNNTLTDLKSRFSKDGYMSHLSSELADEFPSDLQ